MTRALLVPAVLAPMLVLAGCGRGAPAGIERAGVDQSACERLANDDPAVKDLIIKGAGNPHFELENQDALRAAKQDATVACLRARGIVPPGGVERQKPL